MVRGAWVCGIVKKECVWGCEEDVGVWVCGCEEDVGV